MYSRSEDEAASDAGAHGPGSPVADLSASREGTTDETGTVQGQANEQVVALPLGSPIRCVGCLSMHRDCQFLSESDFAKHVSKQHSQMAIFWTCKRCCKAYKKVHALACHIPKCKGPKIAQEKEFKCSECADSFNSQRGLSTHERHRHPAMRNSKRKGTDGVAHVVGRRGAKASVWSEEETLLLRELDQRFQGSSQMNARMREFFPDKTLKQISDKRRQIKPQPEEVC